MASVGQRGSVKRSVARSSIQDDDTNAMQAVVAGQAERMQ